MISVSAPGKLLLMGEHAVVYGRPCIVTAIDARLSVSVEERQGSGTLIDAPQVTDTRFVSEALRVLGRKWMSEVHGVTLHTKSDFSSRFGFGSSAAATVATVFAMHRVFQKKASLQEIFELAYEATQAVQGGGSGFDVAGAVWGGTLYYQNQGKLVEAVEAPHLPLVIGYTGVKADTMTLVSQVAGKHEREKEKVERIFAAIEQLVIEARRKMDEGDWERVGRLFDFNQEYLRDLGVSSEKLEALISAAKAAGAWGAKLSGAGGGDCMIALVSPDKREAVESAILGAEGEVMRFSANAEGVRSDA